MAWTIGLMSGTSLDGVDAVLAEDGPDGEFRSRGHVHLPMPAPLRAALLALNRPAADELHAAALAANALSRLYAETVTALLAASGLAADAISAIGAHGQTVRHRPREFDGNGYTLQLLNGALLAELCGIAVVCDFRSRDLAAGGEGAPLVPAFHAAVFGWPGHDIAVLNLGGIANLTLLPAAGAVSGFDCGPGNMLMDGWCQRHLNLAYDADGAWAAGGRVDAALLQRLLAEPYFARLPPKSTGRELFDAAWLDARLAGISLAAVDVMATLGELTACSAAEALLGYAPATRQLLVCGGGAYNSLLMARIKSRLGAGVAVASTANAGVPPDQVEALAFAWLARAHLRREPGNLPDVTGARAARVLGALYPAA
ncbi:anhydro-N-acetylmuramic acid kinase [Rubrivivax sp. A210]|uniref:anhydro-N-acetylmuramic acid kinase n=1 Tax=Rubrivivax sp. A210 TaxID=2772301 RepID=UPI00191B1341|nr:anhydro-N-acetylmuramic acid kinase [Rubrivivax sp. A210]CAD5374315.1 anhydro-N-acetylmuramic acid kinase [Rubrivivax sp. A210]